MKLWIANSCDNRLSADRGKTSAVWRSQAILWWAEEGDVVLAPGPVDEEFFEAACEIRNINRDRIRVLVPPPSPDGDPRLTPDRLLHPDFVSLIITELRGEVPTAVESFWPQVEVEALASIIEGEPWPRRPSASADQDIAFHANSKATFRLIAALTGAAVMDGFVTADPVTALTAARSLLAEHGSVMLKQEFATAGDGNTVITTSDARQASGARDVIRISDGDQLRSFLGEHWAMLTDDGRHRLVLEAYIFGCTSYFVEFDVGDRGVIVRGDGELIMAPQGAAQTMPIRSLPLDQRDALEQVSRPFVEGLREIGFRGNVSMDLVVTPSGRVFLTEHNGRITSSTHIYAVIGDEIVGPDWREHRTLYEAIELRCESFADARERLTSAGLAYDASNRRGVILTSPFYARLLTVMHCIVGVDLDDCLSIKTRLSEIFPSNPDRGHCND